MTRALINAEVLIDRQLVSGRAVLIEGERIAAVVPTADVPHDADRTDLAGLTLAPGLIDIQVNGGGGVLFNDVPTVETIARIGAAHRAFGTTGFLPTLISDDLAVVRAGVAAVDEAIAAGVPGVLGIHIEGPFLNAERKGIHDPDRMRLLDETGLEAVTALKHGRTLVTLAPELTTPAMIARLTSAGVTVAAGHTNATFDQIETAADAGLTGLTHLYNAMSPLASRKPGVVGAALTDGRLWCSIIVDGQHVHPAAIQLAISAKGVDRTILVTDAMPSVGAVEKSFVLQGHAITVRDGACYNEDGTLAGSDLDMASAVRNVARIPGVSRADALMMASTTPAAFLGLGNHGRIAAGAVADLVALDDAGMVVSTWIGGATPA